MKILAIETSCDETAVAILESLGDIKGASITILGNALYSQASLHAEYGGVYPSLAKREHQSNLAPLATRALKEAGLFKTPSKTTTINRSSLESIRDEAFKLSVEKFLTDTEKPDIDMIAVTKGPGLEPALWTGINFAEALGTHWKIPVTGIDHLEGHLVSAILKKTSPKTLEVTHVEFPILSLLISGGHTEFIVMSEPFKYKELGGTRDDAVGEAFDKVARLLDIPYPGGPGVSALASLSRSRGEKNAIQFPRPMLQDDSCDFSFSGLKTAVLYKIRDMKQLSESDKQNIAEAFEDSVRDVIVSKTRRAVLTARPKIFAIGGGVSANTEIRRALIELMQSEFPDIKITFPEDDLTGDNAVMIGAAALLRGEHHIKTSDVLTAFGNLRLAE
ncbi:tRNA (adenosine(37)-N6)-threonylcarbamoyltransferase complex transferase subunit TsaD [Patescibacteria group bacterium]|nr:MAG: tRNA (adenosine(37)-N6)-threonylcarbamoyltransferase complex transferase subunit TsaD [Patescibacteria group bacterium]